MDLTICCDNSGGDGVSSCIMFSYCFVVFTFYLYNSSFSQYISGGVSHFGRSVCLIMIFCTFLSRILFS